MLVYSGDEIYDYSLDLSISPKYPHEPWPSQSVRYGSGAFWNNGFLICGGMRAQGAYNGTNHCYHRQLGGSEESLTSMVTNRTFLRMVIAGGRPWVTGGAGGNFGDLIVFKTTEILDHNNEWELGPDLPLELFSHCLCPVQVGKQDVFLLHGGSTFGWDRSARIWLFHWPSQSWSALPNMTNAITNHACAPFTAKDGINMVITAGGSTMNGIVSKVIK